MDAPAPSLDGVRLAGFTILCHAAIARAFEHQATISTADLCRLLPIDAKTLRRHIRAGQLEYVRLGFGETAPRRFTLEAIMRFLGDRSERQCRNVSLRSRPASRTVSSEEDGGIRALRGRLNAGLLDLKRRG